MSGSGDFSVLVADLAFAGVATFVAVTLWSLSRQPSWMLVVIATVVRFGDSVFQMLERLGILDVSEAALLGLPVFWIVIRVVPWLLLIVAFALEIRNSRV